MKNTHEIAVLQMASNQQCMSIVFFLLVALALFDTFLGQTMNNTSIGRVQNTYQTTQQINNANSVHNNLSPSIAPNIVLCSVLKGIKAFHGIGKQSKIQITLSAAQGMRNINNITIEDFVYKIVQAGYGFSTQLRADKQGWGRRKTNFSQSNIIALDFDKGLTLEDAYQNTFFQQHAMFLYTTVSHTPGNHRFRVVFCLKSPIKKAQDYEAVVAHLLHKFPQADQSAKDATRFWLGAKDCHLYFFNNILGVSSLDLQASVGKVPLKSKQKNFSQTASTADGISPKIHYRQRGKAITPAEAQALLKYIPKKTDYEQWRNIVFAVGSEFDKQTATHLIEGWSPGNDKHYQNLICRADPSYPYAGTRCTIATLYHYAKQHGAIIKNHVTKRVHDIIYDDQFQIKRYISEVEEDLFQCVKQKSRSIIASRMGNGKSTFIKYLHAKGKSVLVLSPTVPLTEQQGCKLEGADAITGKTDPETARTVIDRGTFICTTFDMFVHHKIDLRRFDFVVIDEIHMLQSIYSYRKKACTGVLMKIKQAECVIGLTGSLTDNLFREIGFHIIGVNDQRTDTIDITVGEYEKDKTVKFKDAQTEFIISLLESHSFSDQRVILRVNDKNVLDVITKTLLSRKILRLTEIETITSDSKATSDTYRQIIENNTIPPDIKLVLCTSVLDVGIDILDKESFRLIMIDPKSPEDIIQFAHRCREAIKPVLECYHYHRPIQKKELLDLEPVEVFCKQRDVLNLECQKLNMYRQEPEYLESLSCVSRESLYEQSKEYIRYNIKEQSHEINQAYLLNNAHKLGLKWVMETPKNCYDFMQKIFPYCNVTYKTTTPYAVNVVGYDIQEKYTESNDAKKSVVTTLYTIFKEHPINFLLAVSKHNELTPKVAKRIDEYVGKSKKNQPTKAIPSVKKKPLITKQHKPQKQQIRTKQSQRFAPPIQAHNVNDIFDSKKLWNSIRKILLEIKQWQDNEPTSENTYLSGNGITEWIEEMVKKYGTKVEIFTTSTARTIVLRYMELIRICIPDDDAVRLVEECRSNEKWHNLVTEFRHHQLLWIHEKHPQIFKIRQNAQSGKEAKADACIWRELTAKKNSFEPEELYQTVSEIISPFGLKESRRNIAKLVEILFFCKKDRPRNEAGQRISKITIGQERCLNNVLDDYGINRKAYLQVFDKKICSNRKDILAVYAPKKKGLFRN